MNKVLGFISAQLNMDSDYTTVTAGLPNLDDEKPNTSRDDLLQDEEVYVLGRYSSELKLVEDLTRFA